MREFKEVELDKVRDALEIDNPAPTPFRITINLVLVSPTTQRWALYALVDAKIATSRQYDQ